MNEEDLLFEQEESDYYQQSYQEMTQNFGSKLAGQPAPSPVKTPPRRANTAEEVKTSGRPAITVAVRKVRVVGLPMKVSHKELQPVLRTKRDIYKILSKEGKAFLSGDRTSRSLANLAACRPTFPAALRRMPHGLLQGVLRRQKEGECPLLMSADPLRYSCWPTSK